jgi:uncharacterized protein
MDLFDELRQIVQKEMSFCPGHDFEHVKRVHDMAIRIAEDSDVDMDVIRAAALLHDIGGKKEMDDATGRTDHAIESAKMAGPILERLGFTEDKIRHIQDCIVSHRYRTENKPKSMEAKIVFDADKLETTGAIGIARMFAWIGRNNAHIYRKVDINEYAKENLGGKIHGRIQDKTAHSPQINWETKDRHLIKTLYTEKAKMIAAKRIKFFKDFLDRLEQECRI